MPQQIFIIGAGLFIAGSETAERSAGYTDGAVRSGQWVARQLLAT